MKIIIIITIILFTIFSCKENDFDAQYTIENMKYFKYYKKDIKNFSFLSKYINLEVVDLSGSNVKDISFVKKLKKLKILVLEETSILDYKTVKEQRKNISQAWKNYETPKSIREREFLASTKTYHNSRFFILDKDDEVIDLRFLGKYTGILGSTPSSKLKILKLNLNTDKYIKDIKVLKNLDELHLMGDIKILPTFQPSLYSLYLYNLNIKNYSFLKESSIREITIITRDYNNKKYWDNLRKQFPLIDFNIKNILFLPTKFKCYNPDVEKAIILTKKILDPQKEESLDIKESFTEYKTQKHIKLDSGFLHGSTSLCIIIHSLRKNELPKVYFSLEDYIFLIEVANIDVNHIWSARTFLDKAIDDENNDAVDYIENKGGKTYDEINHIKKRNRKPYNNIGDYIKELNEK